MQAKAGIAAIILSLSLAMVLAVPLPVVAEGGTEEEASSDNGGRWPRIDGHTHARVDSMAELGNAGSNHSVSGVADGSTNMPRRRKLVKVASAPRRAKNEGITITKDMIEDGEIKQELVNAKLIDAAGGGRLDDVNVLLRTGADIMHRDEGGRTALLIACMKGYLDLVMLLADRAGPELLVASAHDGETVLHAASSSGRLDIVKYILGKGLAVSELLMARSSKNFGRAALHIACLQGHTEIARYLCDRGGREQLMAADDAGSTALHIATSRGNLDIVQFLVARAELMWMPRELLLSQDKGGFTALHMASSLGRIDVLKYLADVGGRELLMARNNDGKTALHSALRCVQAKIRLEAVNHLAAKGGRELLMATTKKGETALHIATRFGFADVVERLAELATEGGGREL